MKKKILGILILVVGVGIVVYPIISGINAALTQTVAVIDYQRDIEVLTEEQKQKELEKAQEYNEELAEGKGGEPDLSGSQDVVSNISYLEMLNVNNKIGIITIPKIDVCLPIYHGVTSQSLEIGVGHMENTSLPIGGINTHTVLSGHTGLVKSKFFDDIDKLDMGDKFYVKVLDHTLTYQVDQIKIVLPDDQTYIQIEEGKDYVTLVTCTPYGINTHRLLVRGTRIENDEEQVGLANSLASLTESELEKRANKYFIYLVSVIIGLVILFIIVIRRTFVKNKNIAANIEKIQEEEMRKLEEKERVQEAIARDKIAKIKKRKPKRRKR